MSPPTLVPRPAPRPAPRRPRAPWLAAWLVLLLGLAACGGAPEPPPTRGMFDDAAPEAGAPVEAGPAIPDDAPRVVFLGDSISAGLHLAADQAYPAVVQRRLAEAGLPFQLNNAGVSGDTSAGGLRRLDWVLQTDPDVVVIELGGNDGLRGQPLESIAGNLRAIVAGVREAGAVPVLLGIQMPPNLGVDYAPAFAGLYDELAEELAIEHYVPRFLEPVGGRPELNLRDGLHPNPQGHEVLAEQVVPVLREALEGLAAD